MKTVEIDFVKPHIGQREILASKSRFVVAACGRRFGKSEIAKRKLITTALQGKQCWWLSPTYSMASQTWRDIKHTLKYLRPQINQTERIIEIPGGGSISVKSTHSSANLRGAGLDFAILDEAAFMDADVWPQVVRPMLLERRGGAWFLSTPFGRNHFWELYKLGLDPLEEEWESFHFPSSSNPMVQAADLENIHRNTPERIWKEEYLAEFTDSSGTVFRNVKERALVPTGMKPEPGKRYLFGVDWARDNDYTVISIIDVDAKRIVFLDRFNQISWTVQRGRLKALYDLWKPISIWAESNSIGSVNIEALQNEGLPVRAFATTAQSKAPLIEALALALENETIELLNDDVLINELISYRLERLPAGGYRYSAPSGQHDDTVIAVALCWHGVSNIPGGAVSIDWW